MVRARPREAIKPYSVLNGGNDRENTEPRKHSERSRRSKPGPIIPLRFEDDHERSEVLRQHL